MTLQKQTDWISVEDKLPPEDIGDVLYTDGIKVSKGWYCHKKNQWFVDRWYGSCDFDDNDDKSITHWMPLPKPPKKE